MTKWHPIETAPKDGRDVLLFTPSPFNGITIGSWGKWIGGWGDQDGDMYPDPTHWMPLPEPPESNPKGTTDVLTKAPQETSTDASR